MDSRRDALKKFAGAVAIAGVGAAAGDANASLPRQAAPRPAGTPVEVAPPAPSRPWTLLRSVEPGQALGAGWHLADLGPVAAGAVVVHLVDVEGRSARVHLCARDGEPDGVAHTDRFDLLLMNRGDGQTPSDEGLGRVVIGLAAIIARNEAAALAAHPELAGLLPHEERLRSYVDTNRLA